MNTKNQIFCQNYPVKTFLDRSRHNVHHYIIEETSCVYIPWDPQQCTNTFPSRQNQQSVLLISKYAQRFHLQLAIYFFFCRFSLLSKLYLCYYYFFFHPLPFIKMSFLMIIYYFFSVNIFSYLIIKMYF